MVFGRLDIPDLCTSFCEEGGGGISGTKLCNIHQCRLL